MTKDLLNKIQGTQLVIMPCIAAVLGIWAASVDWAVYTESLSGVFAAIIGFLGLFAKK